MPPKASGMRTPGRGSAISAQKQTTWFNLYARLQVRQDILQQYQTTSPVTAAILVQRSGWDIIPCVPQSLATTGPKACELLDRAIPGRQPMNGVGTRPLVCTQELPASALPARALDQMLHHSDRPWTHVRRNPTPRTLERGLTERM